MKILPVSFSFKSKYTNVIPEHQFFYTASEFKTKKTTFEHFKIATGMLALTAVLITLFNLGAKKRIPKTVFVV